MGSGDTALAMCWKYFINTVKAKFEGNCTGGTIYWANEILVSGLSSDIK